MSGSSSSNTSKTRFISFLPEFQQTDELSNFFGTTIDELFQNGISDSITGYIGRIPTYSNPITDFYVNEPTTSRLAYQLESGMVSRNATSAITNALSYPDFVSHLAVDGANISDHQRMFETDYYSWAPPINIDMISNYREYYWFGDASGSGDLPTLVLTVPINYYTGNGATTTFALPASIDAVPVGDEIPTVFVNNIPVVATPSGNNIVCATAPGNGTTVLVCRVPSLAASITGNVTVDVSDINTENVVLLTSTMRIQIIDASTITGAWDVVPWDYENFSYITTWDEGGTGIYMVDGIGLSVRLTPDASMIRDTTLPQYITIDRSSVYPNLWSYHNSWVHKDSYAWAKIDFPARQATRPIIEFIRDIVFYPGQVWQESADPLFMLYDLEGFALNDPINYPLSNFQGNRIFGYAIGNSPVDPELNRSLSYDNNGYPVFDNDAYAISYDYTTNSGTFPITSLYCYGTATIVSASFIGSMSGNVLTVTSITSGSLEIGQSIVGNNIGTELIVIALMSGTGGIGTYRLNSSVTVNSENLFALSIDISSLWHKEQFPTVQTINSNLFYETPLGLQANPSSEDVTTISRSTWIEHFPSLIANQNNFSGQPLSDNNYRDSPRDLSVGQYILQHRAPLLKAMLISSDNNLDLPQSIRFADQEYNKFRNKFIRKLIVINDRGLLEGVDPTVFPDTWVTTALFEMNRNQNTSFPFALSTMGGGQYFIPPTPASLGILPAVIPALITDDTVYNDLPNTTPTTLLRGHDGSLTPLFGDWRDTVLLALEQRIYNNLPTQFQTEARLPFDIQQWIGNKFILPVNGYSFSEASTILGPMFEIWVQNNRLDYRLNPNYDYSNPFTWNFNGVKDIFGNPLPGNWRAIYRYYYGTDAPHTRPWEMLGFAYEPSWWIGAYGSAPYLRTNTALWTDLEHGTIVGGPRIGTDTNYARPGLSNLIPVDNSGNLFDPVQTGIVTVNVPISVSSRSWQPGDQSPVENLWINSPSYKYTMALGAFLMKPARFTEECWDTLDIGHIGPQWVNVNSNLPYYLARPLNVHQYVHGEIRPDGSTAVITGMQQWISDYIISTGKNVSIFGNEIRGLDVRLVHQMAGFVSSDEVQLLADNFGLIPSEDINVFLYTSPATDVEVYSGVILQWTGTSWRVLGYDARNPTFTIIPPDTSGPKGIISLATAAEPAIVPWRPSTYYPTGILVSYLDSVYQSKQSHMSGPQFESNYWTARPDLNTAMIRAPRVITYYNGLKTTQSIPYGTEFDNYQDIANFLLGWQRYLVSRGWIFDGMTPDSIVMDWSLSVKEFLTWAQIQWQPGNFIALSPGNKEIKFSTTTGTILNVEDAITGFFGLLDRSGNPIRENVAQINRLDGQITIFASNADIFCTRLEITDVEHLLVVDNVTIFNDDIYLPLFNMRQDRLLLICHRGPQWAGRLDAPGFMVIGNTLKSNFQKSANDVRYMFDIELADNKELRDYARHVVAFQQRSYLNNLLIDDTEQFEFYQGMIQQKGAPGVFQKLMRSTLASSNSNTQFLEEWAFLMGEYGAPIDPFITFQITQRDTRIDPQLVRFVNTPNSLPTWIDIPLYHFIIGTKTSATLVPGNTFVLNGFTVTVKTSPYNIATIATDINNLSIPNTTAIVTFSGALQINNVIGGSITLDFGIGIPLQTLGFTIGTFGVDQWYDRPTTSNFFSVRNLPYSLPSAGPVRLSDVINTAFYITDVPNIYTTQLAAGIVSFPANSLTWVYEREDGTWTVLQSFDTGSVPNAILETETAHEDVSITDTRIFFQNTMTLTTADIGNYLIVDGHSDSNPELHGLQVISAVNVGLNYCDVMTIGVVGHDFTSDPADAPVVRILREVRFTNLSTLTSAPYNWTVGNIAWIDTNGSGKWEVLRWDGSSWIVIRIQPSTIDSTNISETVLYHENTQLAGQQLYIHEPVVPDIDVIDPLSGLLAGISEREIDFKVPYDPARYNSGNSIANNVWGDEQVGRVWWNISTIKFLEPYTDTIGITNSRDITELSYRTSVWAQIAPNTSVDVYEWTKSIVSPQNYKGSGTLLTDHFGNFVGNWIEVIEYNPIIQKNNTQYYYWVKGLSVKPNVDFRNIDIATVAKGITNPSSLDLAWLAPINTDSLIFSGLLQYLNDVDTVIKIRLTIDPENQGRHNEWTLMRPTDQTTLPTDIMWTRLKNSLSSFNQYLQFLPRSYWAPTRATGILFTQNIFNVDPKNNGSRSGLMDARQTFVGSINNILSETAINVDRETYIATITRSDNLILTNQYLNWTQIDKSYPWEQPPANEWDVVVYSLKERNQLVARADFLAAVSSLTTIRVLLNGVGNPTPLQTWSIWDFNPTAAAYYVAAYPLLTPFVAILQNIDNPDPLLPQIFTLALSYEWSVDSMIARDALTLPLTITVGDRVLVTTDTSTFGFWSIWKYEPANPDADAYGFILWRVQAYRTNDFIADINWYASGYSASNPPIVSYATIPDRNNAVTSSFANTFVKVDNDGTGRWVWCVLEQVLGTNGPIEIPEVVYPGPVIGITLVWKTVAIENGTIELSKNFYDPARVVHGVATTSITDINNRDGSWEIYILIQALIYGGLLLDSELNQFWFNMVNFCFVQQSDVNWAFKTSFLNIVGYDVPLEETPYVIPDQTNNLVGYVNEIKPYRVKIREFSTQYSTDIDLANTTVTDFDVPVYFDPLIGRYRVLNPTGFYPVVTDIPIFETLPWVYWYDNYLTHPDLVRGFDITMVFDRYASEFDNWDVDPWDVSFWDDNELLLNDTYVHTFVNKTLTTPGPTISVDDVRFLYTSFITLPITINLGTHSYQIATVTQDVINVSTILHGVSGTLTTVSGNITVSDGTSGNVVEAIIPMPSAASKIISYYEPTAGMAPNDLILLMNLDYPSQTITYQTTVTAVSGATVLTFASTIGVLVDQGIAAPFITPGTMVAAITSTTVTLSRPITGKIFSGTNIVFNLTNWIDGGQLVTLSSPSDFDTLGFDGAGLDTVYSNYSNLDFDGGGFYNITAIVHSGDTALPMDYVGGLIIGQAVYGTNIPDGTLIQNIVGLNVTISEPTTGSIAIGTSIQFSSYPGIDINPNLVENTPGSWSSLLVGNNPARKTNSMRDPYFSQNHPEERLPFTADDGLQLIVTAGADSGGPPQIIKEFNVSSYGTSTATLFFDLIAQAAAGIMVFRDGVRAVLGIDYTVDHFHRTVDVTITGIDFVQIHAFGFGGTSVISEQHYIAFSANPFVLDKSNILDNVMVVENGVILGDGISEYDISPFDSSIFDVLSGEDYDVSSSDVTILTPPFAGTDVAYIVYDGGISSAAIMTTQTLSYNISQQWTLNPHDADTVPEHAGTIVEINGLRLAPYPTFYGNFTLLQEWLFLPDTPDPFTTILTVYVDGVLYIHAIPYCYDIDPVHSAFPFFIDGTTFVLPPVVPGRFVIFNNNLLVALDPTFTGNVAIVMNFPSSPPDYTVVSGLLTINSSLILSDFDLVSFESTPFDTDDGSFIQATTFSNASSMGIETVVYEVGSVEQYFVPMPFAKDYAIVSMNGKALAPDFDYEIYNADTGWDSIDWDNVPFDLEFKTGILEIFAPTSGNIVATIITAPAAREEMEWRVANSGPAITRMIPILDDFGNAVFVNKLFLSDFDLVPFESTLFDTNNDSNVNVSGEYPTYDVVFDYYRQTPYMAGSLANNLSSTDNQITINLFLKQLAPKLQDPNPIAQPTSDKPGVIWIRGERIEYFSYARSGNVVTLEGLRRGTNETAIAEHRLVTTGTGTGSPQVFVISNTYPHIGDIEVKVAGIPSAAFTFSVVGPNLEVVLTAPVGDFVTVAVFLGFTYFVGTAIYNGVEMFGFPVPIGPSVGDREIVPMTEIIMQ